MSLTNIKLKRSEGFTIVELLIVVVVIAILAAITIVSYNGITNKAHSSASAATAATLQKKVELYNSDKGSYPTALSQLGADSTASWYLPATGVTLKSANPATTDPDNSVMIKSCGTNTGVQIVYNPWASGGVQTITTGTGTCSGTAWTS